LIFKQLEYLSSGKFKNTEYEEDINMILENAEIKKDDTKTNSISKDEFEIFWKNYTNNLKDGLILN
jgi:hypothetical protein